MKRKVIFIIIAVLVGTLIGYIIYSKTNNYNSIRKIDVIVVENEKTEDKDEGGSEILEPPIIKESNLELSEDDTSIKSKEQTSSVKNNNKQSNNVENKQIKEDNNVSSNVDISPPSEKKEEIISSNEDNKQPEINIESPKEEIIIEMPSDNTEDLTLQELKSHTFPTYQDCQKKGIEIGLTDTVGIDRTYCESVGYKGELVGYKLFIIYATGEIKEYKW